MAWGKYRKGLQTVIALPPAIKGQLIKNKALGLGGIGQQIVEALQYKWSNQPPVHQAPAVVANPTVASGRYAGMRQQTIPRRPGDPKFVGWNL